MESSGLVAAKFCLKLSCSDTSSNELTIPSAFYSKYGHLLVDTVELTVRNGYVLALRLDKSTGVLSGLSLFFEDFQLKGGELLLFEYFGRYNIYVYILGVNGSEIRYPKRIRYYDDCYPRLVTIGDGGWRFVKMNCEIDSDGDEITPPAAFLERCEFALPNYIDYVISNGKKFHGSYCRTQKKFAGLRSLCDIVGVANLGVFHMMLYEFHVKAVIKISVFDENLNEIVFSGTPLTIDGNSQFPSKGSFFKILVEEKHMSKDCYFVEISNEFRELVNMWDTFQSINVYSGNDCWMLCTRKRDDYFCRTIEGGWHLLRDGMKVEVGDVLIFECAVDSFDQFAVRVLKDGEGEV